MNFKLIEYEPCDEGLAYCYTYSVDELDVTTCIIMRYRLMEENLVGEAVKLIETTRERIS